MVNELQDAFFRAHSDLPREAPGSEATTRLLLELVGDILAAPRILDVGCGTGPATVPLVIETGGAATAVDLHEPFLDGLRDRAAAAGVADLVTPVRASMTDLPVNADSVDLLWAEGSAYVMGFDAALEAWRPLLSAEGVMVVTECEWIVDEPSAGARAFWDRAYPPMRGTAQNIEAARRAGFEVCATYLLPESDWAEYYEPLTAAIEEMRDDGVADDLLVAIGEEIEIRRRHGHEYGYTGYALRPR